MEGRRRDQEALLAFLREVSPPPGVEVQVYRRRRDEPKKWEYLGFVELNYGTELEFDTEVEKQGRYWLCPLPKTQRIWGGGKYQFRFRWRDELGGKKRKFTKNVDIAGAPKPRRRDSAGF